MAEQKNFAPERTVPWKILNASHIGLDKILEEFIDNAVSAHAHEIRINLIQETEDDDFNPTVEDGGGEIAVEGRLEMDALVPTAKSHGSSVPPVAEILSRRWSRVLKPPKIRLLTWEDVRKGATC